jgi:hypothetical protein
MFEISGLQRLKLDRQFGQMMVCRQLTMPRIRIQEKKGSDSNAPLFNGL